MTDNSDCPDKCLLKIEIKSVVGGILSTFAQYQVSLQCELYR